MTERTYLQAIGDGLRQDCGVGARGQHLHARAAVHAGQHFAAILERGTDVLHLHSVVGRKRRRFALTAHTVFTLEGDDAAAPFRPMSARVVRGP